ncbi:MAG: hypothetical protein NT047_07540 [Deltaproteobacteria bacterium]|nr:hypothetical protein [Deltaproteobacteria bacterium]
MINNATIQFPFSHGDLQMKVAYNATGDPEYIGRARPAALTSAAEWQIKKVTYDTDRKPTAVQFADSVNDYTKIWDSRTGYSYS